MRRPASLQLRLLLPLLGLICLAWLLSVAWLWIDAREQVGELLDAHLAQSAALLLAQQAHEAHEDDLDVDAPALHKYAPKVAFQVFHGARLALRSANAPRLPMLDAAASTSTGLRTLRIDGVAWRVFATGDPSIGLSVYVAEQMQSRAAILWAVARSALLPVLLVVPVLGMAIWWTVGSVIEPLRELGRVLKRRPADARAPVALAGLPLEMTPAVEALNDLLGRIETLMESQRRFTADAAHELRTPIAAIRAQAEAALGEEDAANRRHALRATIAGCDRARRLVEQMLTLSRLESAAAPTLATLELRALVRQAAAEVAPLALGRRQDLSVEAEEPCLVRGDALLLGVLVRNLLDNACRYSPAQATIRVGLARRADAVVLRVEDSGPGMSEADRGRVGERFFRVLGSDAQGTGLGWSIVRRIAAVHDARVRTGRSPALGGFDVEVAFRPAAAFDVFHGEPSALAPPPRS
ncbi:MAG: sensor histidine kinase N-terminal domain-containing protein [Burkholderiales bacterium]|nr:sensor histidine kinase N-terminal domain-containing protein [Burkholderiales bacterium]